MTWVDAVAAPILLAGLALSLFHGVAGLDRAGAEERKAWDQVWGQVQQRWEERAPGREAAWDITW